jgi:hypothetical protein
MMPDDGRGPTLLARPVMREAFRKQLRSRVMVEAAVAFAPNRRRSPFLMFLRPTFAPAFAAALVLIVAMAGATSAAASSLPGDPAFGLKRAAEDLRVALAFDDVVRVRLLADLADRRLAELAEVVRERPASAPAATAELAGAVDRIADAVGGLRESDGDSKRAAALALAEAARSKHIGLLDSLKPKLPVEAQPSLQRVIEKEKQRATDADRSRPGGGSDERTGDGKDKGTGNATGTADKKDKRAPDSKDQPTGGRSDGRAGDKGDKKDEGTADRSDERTDERSGDRTGTGQSDVKQANPTPKPTPKKK